MDDQERLANMRRKPLGEWHRLPPTQGDIAFLLARLGASEAECGRLREALEVARDLLHAGRQLANIAYNLAQRDTLESDWPSVRQTCDVTRREWDAVDTKRLLAAFRKEEDAPQ